MYQLTHIFIRPDNEAATLYQRECNKIFANSEQVAEYRKRIELLARNRYNRDHISVDFYIKQP